MPFISKVREKSIHDQTEDYLHRNVLLCVYESGFGANQSISTCLSQLTDKQCWKRKTYWGDFNQLKAFDTLDHKMCIGFSEKKIKEFYSYLSNRAFFVSLDNVFSETGTINCDVLQGCILGPLLILLYINDIPQALSQALCEYVRMVCW